MGDTTTATSKVNVPDFTRERCKQCGICAHFCPKGAIELDAEKNPQLIHPEACTACKLCEYLCPDFGIRVHSNGHTATAPPVTDEDPDSRDQ
ncbi:MAG: 4Fe-4S binding protein [Thermoleophilia bacterium]